MRTDKSTAAASTGSGRGNHMQSYSQVNGSGWRTNSLWPLRNRLSIGTALGGGPVNLFGGVTLVSTVLTTHTDDNDLVSFRNSSLQMD